MAKNESFSKLVLKYGLIAFIVVSIIPHINRNIYRVTVNDKAKTHERSWNYPHGRNLIFTSIEDGDNKVFKNVNSLLEFKTNSNTLQEDIEIGKTYEIRTYGFRLLHFSDYENIVGLKEITQ